jgi:hypothetical protein
MNTYNQIWSRLLQQQLDRWTWMLEAFPDHPQSQEIQFICSLAQERLDQIRAEQLVEETLESLGVSTQDI